MTPAVRRQRLDTELVRRGLARSRQQAAELIAAGRVSVGGATASKPATQVDLAAAVLVREDETGPGWASRGAHKLHGALAALALDVTGRRCLDAGASTGGFTDVLLRAGAASVIAVDVGYGQLVWALQQDPRVEVHDRTNVRELRPEQIGALPSLVVADLSFISLGLVLPALVRCSEPDADLVLMVKPQFEVGRERLGHGGVVRSAQLRAEAVRGVAATAAGLGLDCLAAVASPLPGPSGNVEYFVHLRRGAPRPAEEVAALVAEAVRRGPTGPEDAPPPEAATPADPAPTGPAPTGPTPAGPAPTGPAPTGTASPDPAPADRTGAVSSPHDPSTATTAPTTARS